MATLYIDVKFSNPKWYELDYYLLWGSAIFDWDWLLSKVISRRISVSDVKSKASN